MANSFDRQATKLGKAVMLLDFDECTIKAVNKKGFLTEILSLAEPQALPRQIYENHWFEKFSGSERQLCLAAFMQPVRPSGMGCCYQLTCCSLFFCHFNRLLVFFSVAGILNFFLFLTVVFLLFSQTVSAIIIYDSLFWKYPTDLWFLGDTGQFSESIRILNNDINEHHFRWKSHSYLPCSDSNLGLSDQKKNPKQHWWILRNHCSEDDDTNAHIFEELFEALAAREREYLDVLKGFLAVAAEVGRRIFSLAPVPRPYVTNIWG